MSDSARDLLSRGIAAAKAKDKEEARFYLQWMLRIDADRQQKAQAWLWLSEVAEEPAEKRNCLEEVLALDPANHSARRGLAILDGRLDPKEIIDPDRPPAASPPEAVQAVTTQRFICQKCGGRMGFQPDGKSLRCEYCGDELTLLAAMNAGAMVQEHDFTVAMATAKGHSSPVGMNSFECQGCGASFLLASSVLSLNCSYCGSAHVVQLTETRTLIPPEGLIPFQVPQKQARQAFQHWFKDEGLQGKVKVTPLRGVYLPGWTFDLSGEVRWQCQVYRDEAPSVDVGGIQVSLGGSRHSRRLVREEGSHLVSEDDILVPASHRLPAELLMEEAECFVLKDTLPYDETYLADWPAEVYQISVSDASLVARRVALQKARKFVSTRVSASLGNVQELQLNSSGIVIESYKLILLPLWVARYRHEETIYHVLVNGQTGKVRAQMPHGRLRRFLDSLIS
jgi:DNA-directed RNA polymerase subunit RPC12/RpoP